ncbi:MAG: aminotransferase class I/II-fold pyridoxal phosphate-dependent enzyme [Syntrophomonadaceae bacterium]|nr:aminotransferase class I/II-fold pyridoxal phosphate-dependent enzyme [Syntrophomonadaceae bacterium]
MNNQTPIFSELCRYRGEDHLRLHMPGHAGGRGINEVLQSIAAIDVTEVAGMDDYHLPQGIIAESQRLLARAVGAGESFYLVNGASSGIHALFMSMAADGEQILLPRSCHRSFFGGMVLSGMMPVYIPSQIDDELGLELAIKVSEVEKCLAQNPDVKAVFITSPSYFGTCSDIESMAAIAGQYNKYVLVDEAHGGHFPFHNDYPAPALAQGAMAAVNGLHKTWPVLNQGACLHLSPGFPEHDRLRQSISLLTTTSPSYPLLASIELARMYMEQEGSHQLEQAKQWSGEYKEKINKIKGLRCYGEELNERIDIAGVDPLKMVVAMPGLQLSGYQMSKILRKQYNIQTEMENENVILAMFSPLHEKADWERFYQALQEIAAGYAGSKRNSLRIEAPPVAEVVLSPREAWQSAKKQVKLADSINLISGEMIAVYPPGIPCLLPGECISAEVMDYLYYVIDSGARIQGPEKPNLNYIQVID